MGPGAGAAAPGEGGRGTPSRAPWTGNDPADAGASVGTTPGFTTTVVAPGEGPGARATLGGGTEGAAGPATAGAVIARVVTAADCTDWTELTSCADGPLAVLCATEKALTNPGDEDGGLSDGTICDSKRDTVPDLRAALGGDATLGGTHWLAAGPDVGATAVGLLLNILAGPVAKGLVEGDDKGCRKGGALGLGESLGLMEGPHNPTDHRDGGVNSSPRNRFVRGERPQEAVEGAGDIARVPGTGGRMSRYPQPIHNSAATGNLRVSKKRDLHNGRAPTRRWYRLCIGPGRQRAHQD